MKYLLLFISFFIFTTSNLAQTETPVLNNTEVREKATLLKELVYYNLEFSNKSAITFKCISIIDLLAAQKTLDFSSHIFKLQRTANIYYQELIYLFNKASTTITEIAIIGDVKSEHFQLYVESIGAMWRTIQEIGCQVYIKTD